MFFLALALVSTICLIVLLEDTEQHIKGDSGLLDSVDAVDEALSELENFDMVGYDMGRQIGEEVWWVFW